MQSNQNKKPTQSTGSKMTKIVIWTMLITTLISVFAALLTMLPAL